MHLNTTEILWLVKKWGFIVGKVHAENTDEYNSILDCLQNVHTAWEKWDRMLIQMRLL